jgi:hypothetical protein
MGKCVPEGEKENFGDLKKGLRGRFREEKVLAKDVSFKMGKGGNVSLKDGEAA